MAWGSGLKAHGLGIMSSTQKNCHPLVPDYMLDGLLVKATPDPLIIIILIIRITIVIIIVVITIILIVIIISPYNPYSIPWIHEDS